MVASRRMAVASPMPISFITRSFSSRKLPKTTTMMAAAAVMTFAVAARPSATEVRLSPDLKHATCFVEPLGAGVEAATAELRAAMQQELLEVQDGYGPHPAGEFWVPARLGGSAPTPEDAAVIETEEAQRKAQARARKAAERDVKGKGRSGR